MGKTQALRRFPGPCSPQGKSLAQPGNLANSVALEPMALVLLAPFISAMSAAAAAAVAAAVAAAASGLLLLLLARAAAFKAPTSSGRWMRR
jgi:amino acid permease